MKEWEKTEIEEGRPDGKISRRQFVNGLGSGGNQPVFDPARLCGSRRCDRNGGNDKRSR